MLKIIKLNSGYGDLQILKGVDLFLSPGTISILMGPNGAGKSTLLKSIFNLTKITSGQIELEKKSLIKKNPSSLLQLGISFVPQGKINFGILSVKDNLLLGAHHLKDKKILRIS